MALTIRLLGEFELQRDGVVVPMEPRPTTKAISLFAFLLLPPGRAFSREHLCRMFWPEPVEDGEMERALTSLRMAFTQIRRMLVAGGEDPDRYLFGRKNTAYASPPPDCRVDVWEVEAELRAVDLAEPNMPEWRRACEAVVARYTGPLLPGYDHPWLRDRRYSLQQRVLECLHDLARADRERKQLARATEWAMRALELDDCDEVSHRNLMELYANLGDLDAVVRQYEACKRALHRGVGMPPDPETVRLFQWLSHGVGQPKGRRRAADRASELPAPSEPVPSRPSDLAVPLVGRDAELERLRAAWRRACSGQGERVLLSGDAGIGKTRLGREFVTEVREGGGLALYAPAYSLERDFLYQPLMAPLRAAFELIEERGLEPCPPVWMRQVARLMRDLQPEEDTAASGDEDRGLEEGLVQFFLHLARQRPLCLFLDDLQHVDSATGSFLQRLLQECGSTGSGPSAGDRPPASLLLLGTLREGDPIDSTWLRAWHSPECDEAPAAVLSLSQLTQAQIVSLLSQLVEGDLKGTSLETLGRRLYEESEGNPFVFWETLWQWFDQGIVVMSREGGWQVAAERMGGTIRPAPAGEPIASRLPPPFAVQAVVRQRLARQREEDRALLECAAVIGRRFTFETLHQAVGGDSRETLAGLERLLDAAFIAAQPRARAYDFRHDKIREVIYDELMPIGRQDLHRRVGEALETIYGAAEAGRSAPEPFPTWARRPPPSPAQARVEEHAEELARHFRAAAPLVGPEKAAWYHYLAGSRARALYAYESAERNLTAARALLADLPPDDDRLALLGQIIEQLAPVYRSCFRRDEARAVLREYIALCDQHGYARGVARGCVLLGLFYETNPWSEGDETSRSMYGRAVEVCERHGLVDWIVYPRARLAHILSLSPTDLDRADELVRATLPRALGLEDPRLVTALLCAQVRIAVARADWRSLVDAFHHALPWGGLPHIHVVMALESAELKCRSPEEIARFRAVCDEIAADYVTAGVHPPLRQWYLSPAEAAPTRGELLLDQPFTSADRHPALTWQDATGRSRLDTSLRPGWLTLAPAQDADLWPEVNMAAPRLMMVTTGDFVAETLLELGATQSLYAGLLLWQDADHFLRLEVWRIAADRLSTLMAFHAPGPSGAIGRGQIEDGSIWIRLERHGEDVRGLFSVDGANWVTAGSARFPASAADGPLPTEQVGLTAHCARADAEVWFRHFRLWGER